MQATTNRKRKIAFFGILIVNFMTMFLVASVGIYGYAVAGYFDNVLSVGMIFTLESVFRCVAIPISGKLSDKIGHRKLFLIALTVYIASFAIVALSPSFWIFTAARAVSGFAWGLFVSNIFVIISDLFNQDEGPKYAGIAQTLSTVAMIISSPVASLLCGIHWRVLFFIAVPILLIGLICCFVGIPDIPKHDENSSKLDGAGCLLTFIVLVPFSLAMNLGNTYGWTSPLSMGLIAVSVIGLILLVIAEKRAVNPLYPAKLLGNRFYLAMFMISTFFSLGNAITNYVPTYIQYVLGFSAVIAGIYAVAPLIVAAVLTTVLGNYAAKYGRYKGIIVFWAASTAVGAVIYWMMPNAATPVIGLVLCYAASFIVGISNSAQQIAPYTYPMKVLKPNELAGGMSFMGLGGVLGNTLGTGLYGALLNGDPTLKSLFQFPVAICAVIVVVFAVLFKDIKSGEKL